MSDRYYVYLLVDHDPQGVVADEVFYVGKGSGRRALEHLQEALAAAAADEASVQQALADENQTDPEELAELHAKTERIIKAVRAGRSVRIDILRANVSESTAFHVESAVIDLLGRQKLTNRIAGHDAQRMPLPLLERLERAEPVTLDEGELAVLVPGGGVWGGGAPVGGLLGAEREVLWDNARHRWSLGEGMRTLLTRLAQEGSPALLISIGTGVGPWNGVVLLVEEIQNVVYDGPRTPGKGWAFERVTPDSARVLAARARLEGQRLAIRPNSGVRYSAALRALAQHQ